MVGFVFRMGIPGDKFLSGEIFAVEGIGKMYIDAPGKGNGSIFIFHPVEDIQLAQNDIASVSPKCISLLASFS